MESQLPLKLLNVWKEFLLKNQRLRSYREKNNQKGFAHKMITFYIYKDLIGFGFEKVFALVNIGFQLKLKSFTYNYKLIQKLLFE
jgi:hypothetical protein